MARNEFAELNMLACRYSQPRFDFFHDVISMLRSIWSKRDAYGQALVTHLPYLTALVLVRSHWTRAVMLVAYAISFYDFASFDLTYQSCEEGDVECYPCLGLKVMGVAQFFIGIVTLAVISMRRLIEFMRSSRMSGTG